MLGRGGARTTAVALAIFALLFVLHVYIAAGRVSGARLEAAALDGAMRIEAVAAFSSACVVAHVLLCGLVALAIVRVQRATYGSAIWQDPRALASTVLHLLPGDARAVVRLNLRMCWCVFYVVEVAYMRRESADEAWDVSAMPTWLVWLQLGLGAVVCSDLALGYAAAERKSEYVFSGEAYTDALLSPVARLLTYALIDDASYVRSSTRFGYLRMVALLDLRATSSALRGLDEVGLLVVRTSVRLAGVVLLFAGFFFEVEAPDHARGFVNYFDFIYYMFITMSTVGYGDWSPSHPLSRAVAMLVIVFVMTTVRAAPRRRGRVPGARV